MPYALEAQESMPDALRRSAREQLESAISELADGSPGDPVKAIHDARKALKKERSLLRLGAPGFDSTQRRAENHAFREAARRLSATRDADVIIQALDDLTERYAGRVPHATFTALHDRLVAERETTREPSSARDTIAAVSDSLRNATARIEDWRLAKHGWAAVGSGLADGYRRGAKAFKGAQRQPSVENLHEWRKRVKDLWYQQRWLTPIAASTMAAQAQDAHHLSELLGDDHDLAVLRDALLTLADPPAVDLEPVLGLIDHRRSQLQDEARFLGRRVYAEAPKAFERRIHRYWKAWRAEIRSGAAHPAAELAEATET